MSYAILSFFKHSKIDYIYEKDADKIIYPCFDCSQEATLNIESTAWICSYCNRNGLLYDLIKEAKDANSQKQKNGKLYHPKKELHAILKSIDQLIGQEATMSSQLNNLKGNIQMLFHYYEGKEKPLTRSNE
ncbi:hypothetical protein [Bacillus paranthracis]|uniref:hypothetical protein n=1 Tax=Bacillus paranthracis TaxID=2026186 RepID=UPI000278FB96|nr:hypothetical protein [Bacillus paranthracis]EJQ03960.1 hypothetical protein IC5_02758 [Bacillus cereus AND1407]MDG0908928.1 hypothetical protein [Bacillus paranthracis]MDR4347257.1 hypothetical protein [Bacillus paranthracis]TKC26058.1 hypothetical protein CQB03_01705 [Bacillus paranthracis]HDR7456212.1 hypothetical protein [Bacillus paranthracis]